MFHMKHIDILLIPYRSMCRKVKYMPISSQYMDAYAVQYMR